MSKKRRIVNVPTDPEVVDPIEDVELVEEIVIPVENVSTFSLKAELQTFKEPVMLQCSSNPLPVLGQGGKIGYGNLYLDGNKVIGELSLDYANPERLSIETGDKLYAHLGYFVRHNPENESPTLVVYEIRINQESPSDTSILPLGKPVL